MTLTERLGWLYQKNAKFVVTINPINLLTPWLLRNAPMLWRTQVGLVVSYAVFAAALLYLWGRSVPVSLETATSLIDLQISIWWASGIAFALISPWLVQNFRTQMESRKRWSAPALFLCYFACFGALSLVPTAYYYGRVEQVAELARPSLENHENEAEYQFMDEFWGQLDQDERSEQALITQSYEVLPKIAKVAERYDLETCITLHAPNRALRPYMRKDSEERFTAEHVTGCGINAESETLFLIFERLIEDHRRYEAVDGSEYSEYYEPRNFVTLAPNGISTRDFSLEFFLVEGEKRASRFYADFWDFVGAVKRVERAKRLVDARHASLLHPLNPGRLLIVIGLALFFTFWSLRATSAPGKRANVIGRLVSFVLRPIERLTRPSPRRFRSGAVPNTLQTLRLILPFLALTTFVIALFLIASNSIVVENGGDLGFNMTGSAEVDMSIGYNFYLATIAHYLPFLAIFIVILYSIYLFRAFRISAFIEINRFSHRLYLPFLIAIVQLYCASAIIINLEIPTLFGIEFSIYIFICLAIIFIAQEAIWFDNYDAAVNLSRSSAGIVRIVKFILYLFVLVGVSYVVIGAIVLFAVSIEAAFSITRLVEELLDFFGIFPARPGDVAVVLLTLPALMLFARLANAMRNLYLNEYDRTPWSMAVDRMIYMSLGFFGAFWLALCALILGEEIANALTPSKTSLPASLWFLVPVALLLLVAAYLALGWFMKPFHQYWEQRIYDPEFR